MHAHECSSLPPSFLSLSLPQTETHKRRSRGGEGDVPHLDFSSRSASLLDLRNDCIQDAEDGFRATRQLGTRADEDFESRKHFADHRVGGGIKELLSKLPHHWDHRCADRVPRTRDHEREREGRNARMQRRGKRERQMSMRNMEGFAAEIGCKSSVTVRSKTDEGGRTGAPVLIQRISFIFSR